MRCKIAGTNTPFRPRLRCVLIEAGGVPGGRAYSVPADDDHVAKLPRCAGAAGYGNATDRPHCRQQNHRSETFQHDLTILSKHFMLENQV